MLNDHQTHDNQVRTAVLSRITDILAEDGTGPIELTGAEQLHEIGVHSMLLARLLVELEAELGVDPFADDESFVDARTVDDLITAYERAAGQAVPVPAP